VGTTTEVWHFLRLLYVKLGVQHCVHEGAEVRPQTPDSIAAQLMKRYKGQHIGLLALVINRKGVHRTRRLGLPARYAFAGGRQFPADHRLSASTVQGTHDRVAGERPRRDAENEALLRELTAALEHGSVLHVLAPLDGLRGRCCRAWVRRHIGKVEVFRRGGPVPYAAPATGADPRLFV
jgi:excinuclease ABC subunit A